MVSPEIHAQVGSPRCGENRKLIDHLDRPLAGFSAKLATNGTRRAIAYPNGATFPADTQSAVKVTDPANSTSRVFALYFPD